MYVMVQNHFLFNVHGYNGPIFKSIKLISNNGRLTQKWGFLATFVTVKNSKFYVRVRSLGNQHTV